MNKTISRCYPFQVGWNFLKKILAFIFLIVSIQLTSCNQVEHDSADKFYALANIYISDVKFKAEITDEYIKFESENLSNQIIYTNEQMIYENINLGITPTNSSSLHIRELLKHILTTKNSHGTYKDINYTCEFDNQNQFPLNIIWGNIIVEFHYFE